MLVRYEIEGRASEERITFACDVADFRYCAWMGDYGIAIAYSTALIAMMMIAIGIIQLAVGERKLGRRATGDGPATLLRTTQMTGARA